MNWSMSPTHDFDDTIFKYVGIVTISNTTYLGYEALEDGTFSYKVNRFTWGGNGSVFSLIAGSAVIAKDSWNNAAEGTFSLKKGESVKFRAYSAASGHLGMSTLLLDKNE